MIFISTAEVAMRPRFFASVYPLIVGQTEVRAFPPSMDDPQIPAYVLSKLRAENIVVTADKKPFLNNNGSPGTDLITSVGDLTFQE
jgi:hypothetical protein